MRVIFSPLAEKQLKKLPKIVQLSLAGKIRNLATGGEITGIKPLTKYKNVFRIRIGDYRTVYKRFSGHYYIILIEHRKSVYETLKRIW